MRSHRVRTRRRRGTVPAEFIGAEGSFTGLLPTGTQIAPAKIEQSRFFYLHAFWSFPRRRRSQIIAHPVGGRPIPKPPLTTTDDPVIKEASSLARKTARRPTSSGCPTRPRA